MSPSRSRSSWSACWPRTARSGSRPLPRSSWPWSLSRPVPTWRSWRGPLAAPCLRPEHVLGPLTEDQRQCLRTVKSAADNLLGIIDDLLDFSKIEAGKLELHRSDFSLQSAVGDTLRPVAIRAHKKGLDLVCCVH